MQPIRLTAINPLYARSPAQQHADWQEWQKTGKEAPCLVRLIRTYILTLERIAKRWPWWSQQEIIGDMLEVLPAKLGAWNPESAPLHVFLKIVMGRFANNRYRFYYYRHAKQVSESTEEGQIAIANAQAAEEVGSESHLMRMDFPRFLAQAKRRVSPTQFRCLELWCGNDITQAEIGRRLGVSRQAVNLHFQAIASRLNVDVAIFS